MSTLEEVKEAEKAMKKAQKELRGYAEGSSQGSERNVEKRRVAAELKLATDAYILAILALGTK